MTKRDTRRSTVGTGPDPIDLAVGAEIRRRRLALDISQEDLGAAVEVSFQQIQKYETGSNRVSASRLWRIAAVLHCSVMDLYGELVPPAPSSEDLFGTARTFRELPFSQELMELVLKLSINQRTEMMESLRQTVPDE